MADYNIQVKGLNEFVSNATKYNSKAKKYISAGLQLSSKKVISNWREIIATKNITYKGGYARSLSYNLQGSYKSEIGTNLEYAPVIEGTKKITRFPMVAPLVNWARIKLGVDRRKAASVGYLIARALYRRGKPKFTYPVAEVAYKKSAPAVFKLMEQAIEKSLIELTR